MRFGRVHDALKIVLGTVVVHEMASPEGASSVWLLEKAARLCSELQRHPTAASSSRGPHRTSHRPVAVYVTSAMLDTPVVEVCLPAGLSSVEGKELLKREVGFSDIMECAVAELQSGDDRSYGVLKLHRPDASAEDRLASQWPQCVAALLVLKKRVGSATVRGWLPRKLVQAAPVGVGDPDRIRVVVSCLPDNTAAADACVASVTELLSTAASVVLSVDPAVWSRITPAGIRTSHGVAIELNADRSVARVSGQQARVDCATLAIQVRV